MSALEQFDGDARRKLTAARDLILEVAKDTQAAGEIVEEVKWGQPSFATRPKTGTPIRLGLTKTGEPAVFVHCQTTLVSDFVAGPGVGASVEGSRAVILPERVEDLTPLIRAALTYHT